MSFIEFISGVIGGLIGGGTLWAIAGNLLLEKQRANWARDLELQKSFWAEELERVKGEISHELKAFESQVDAAQFVTRTHADTEFTAMKEVYQRLAHIKLSLAALDPKELKRQPTPPRKSELLHELDQAKRLYLEKFEEWGLFLQPEIYEDFQRCYFAADAEWERLSGLDTWDGAKSRNEEYLMDHYSLACQRVRDRFIELAALPRIAGKGTAQS